MTEELDHSVIIALGDDLDCKKLFTKINDSFTNDKKYVNTLNKLSIIATSDGGVGTKFRMEITTKYYDLTLSIVVVNPKNIEKLILDSKLENIEGVIIFLNKENSNLYDIDQISLFISKLNDNENCFKSVVLDENEDASKESNDELLSKIRVKFDEIEELITINQFAGVIENCKDVKENDEDSYTDLDEFINCIFVHSWSNIELKSEKNEAGSLKKININANEVNKAESSTDDEKPEKTVEEDSDKDAFNFEDMLMNLSDYKSKASGLEFDERKKFAEDIVLKFWDAIGGDRDEIAGLGDL